MNEEDRDAEVSDEVLGDSATRAHVRLAATENYLALELGQV